MKATIMTSRKRRHCRSTIRLRRRRHSRTNSSNPQIRGIGGFLAGLARVPQILQSVWQMAPLIRAMMDSYSKSNLELPHGSHETDQPSAANELDDTLAEDAEENSTHKKKLLKHRGYHNKRKRRARRAI